MNLSEYRKIARLTALPAALDVTGYLAPMIAGEVGEIYGTLAKANRDGWDTDTRYKAVAKEIGDVLWGVAVLIDFVEPELSEDARHDAWANVARIEELTPEAALKIAYDRAGDIISAAMIRNPVGDYFIYSSAVKLWDHIEHNAGLFVDGHYTFDEVLHMNADKLADRMARNVISGSGNDR